VPSDQDDPAAVLKRQQGRVAQGLLRADGCRDRITAVIHEYEVVDAVVKVQDCGAVLVERVGVDAAADAAADLVRAAAHVDPVVAGRGGSGQGHVARSRRYQVGRRAGQGTVLPSPAVTVLLPAADEDEAAGAARMLDHETAGDHGIGRFPIHCQRVTASRQAKLVTQLQVEPVGTGRRCATQRQWHPPPSAPGRAAADAGAPGASPWQPRRS